MKITRKDVAKYAGVSEQTVSYVLNNSRKFSDDVVNRVNKAIKDLNYQPDMIAKSMSQKQTKSVAVFIRDMENPIFPAIIHGFQKKAFEKGYSVYIADVEGCKDIDFLVTSLISRRIDGVYISMFADKDFVRIVKRFADNGIKVVVGNEESSLDGVPSVTVDFADGMRRIISYLKENGHRKIVYLSGIDVEQKNDTRYHAFCSEYKAAFGEEPTVIENHAPFATTVESGKYMAEKLFSITDDFTAIVTTNDLMAYGVIDALKQKGKSVPDDVSVIGIDDIMFSQYINPPLTTLGYNNEEFGAKTFKVLMKSMSGKDVESTKEYCHIVERSTVKKLQ
ncbi:MAG: LacI family DNA-binding transcriptional regulator [Clostridia bacterium]|nr:LacI family DNA-binding transcriptional regulator [Clostridia bacterium]